MSKNDYVKVGLSDSSDKSPILGRDPAYKYGSGPELCKRARYSCHIDVHVDDNLTQTFHSFNAYDCHEAYRNCELSVLNEQNNEEGICATDLVLNHQQHVWPKKINLYNGTDLFDMLLSKQPKTHHNTVSDDFLIKPLPLFVKNCPHVQNEVNIGLSKLSNVKSLTYVGYNGSEQLWQKVYSILKPAVISYSPNFCDQRTLTLMSKVCVILKHICLSFLPAHVCVIKCYGVARAAMSWSEQLRFSILPAEGFQSSNCCIWMSEHDSNFSEVLDKNTLVLVCESYSNLQSEFDRDISQCWGMNTMNLGSEVCDTMKSECMILSLAPVHVYHTLGASKGLKRSEQQWPSGLFTEYSTTPNVSYTYSEFCALLGLAMPKEIFAYFSPWCVHLSGLGVLQILPYIAIGVVYDRGKLLVIFHWKCCHNARYSSVLLLQEAISSAQLMCKGRDECEFAIQTKVCFKQDLSTSLPMRLNALHLIWVYNGTATFWWELKKPAPCELSGLTAPAILMQPHKTANWK